MHSSVSKKNEMKKIVLSLLLAGICSIGFSQSYSPRTFVKKCKKYMGTPYKYGGNDKNGIDCSGLVYNNLRELNVVFPRISHQQAAVFKEVKVNKARKGDLIYFVTAGDRINHTGVVISKKGSDIRFIHASTSKGVRIDDLNSEYWKQKFVKVTRPMSYL